MKKGFTLAEVLITLAIIGVVAALTIPSVVKNYQKTQTISKLKKVYSSLSQAFNQSQAENGMYQTWETGTYPGAYEYFEKYWKPYLKVQKRCTSYSDCGYESNTPWKNIKNGAVGEVLISTNYRTTFIMQDGTLINLYVAGGANSAPESTIYVDLNNSKEPNRYGRDLFVFYRTEKGILPACYTSTYDNIQANCSKNSNGGTCCARKLALDGWQMKDDYPW